MNWVFKGLKKVNTFRFANALGETEAGHGTGSYMLCDLSQEMRYHYSLMSLFRNLKEVYC